MSDPFGYGGSGGGDYDSYEDSIIAKGLMKLGFDYSQEEVDKFKQTQKGVKMEGNSVTELNSSKKTKTKTGEEVVTVTAPELDLVRQVVNQSGNNQGHSIKDFRLIEKLLEKLTAVSPKRPTPEIPKPKDGKTYTEEEIKVNTELAKELSAKLQEYATKELTVSFTTAEMLIVRQRLSSFNGFLNDPVNRKKALSVADKFGVQ